MKRSALGWMHEGQEHAMKTYHEKVAVSLQASAPSTRPAFPGGEALEPALSGLRVEVFAPTDQHRRDRLQRMTKWRRGSHASSLSFSTAHRLGNFDLHQLPLFVGGVFSFLEGAVGDLAQLGAVVVQGANVPPVDIVGAGLEMVGAEGGEAFQHCVDFELPGEEGVDDFGVFSPRPRSEDTKIRELWFKVTKHADGLW